MLAFHRYHNFGAFSDVTIEFGSQKIKGHKIILAQGSEYFKTLLGGKFKVSCIPLLQYATCG